MKSVALSGMIAGVPDDQIDQWDEVWCLNRAYVKNKRVDRMFCFHEPDEFSEGFLAEINALDVPVYMRESREDIPTSLAYPVNAVVEDLGHTFFVSSVAYMLAMAIYERVDRIGCFGMYSFLDSFEYGHHLHCINFWVGMAMGRGIDVHMGPGVCLAQPFSWQPSMYGYYTQRNSSMCSNIMAQCYKACFAIPVAFERVESTPAWVLDVDDVGRIRTAIDSRNEWAQAGDQMEVAQL